MSEEDNIIKGKRTADLLLPRAIDKPVTWFNEKINLIRNKEKIPYYHRHFSRVPTVDECEVGDMACVFEANEQYKRDKAVDGHIMRILRQRFTECHYYEEGDSFKRCTPLKEHFEEAKTNYGIKYGDLGAHATVIDALMKQKHRMIWERRKAAAEGILMR